MAERDLAQRHGVVRKSRDQQCHNQCIFLGENPAVGRGLLLPELDEIVDMLAKEGKQIVLATSTAALPAWMVKRYPEVTRTDYQGRRHKFGHRHNACPNSLVYQHFIKELAAEKIWNDRSAEQGMEFYILGA